jgi:predicted Zn-dependent protease
MKNYFYDIVDGLCKDLIDEEVLLAEFSGEKSSFIRFNHGKIRQAGDVEQRFLELKLSRGKKVISGSYNLSSNMDEDLAEGKYLVEELRANLSEAPEDPFYKFNETVSSSELDTRENSSVSAQQMTSDINEVCQGLDLVGVLAAGEISRGFASSLGHRKFVDRSNFNFDFACYLNTDKAVKSGYAGIKWNKSELEAKITDTKEKLEVLKKPSKTITPGKYKVYLTPSALQEVVTMLNWGGFSKKSIETKSSPLNHLVSESKALASGITMTQNLEQGFSSNFDGLGYDLPGQVELIKNGKFENALISSRSAQEYNETTNAASEYACSIQMGAGNLEMEKAAEELGEGLYISNLWYLNFSDKSSGKITGMTRFATFWVEDGKISSPVDVMRFDDSIYEIFGSKLDKITKEREYLLDAGTYYERTTSSALLPGIIVNDFEFTL